MLSSKYTPFNISCGEAGMKGDNDESSNTRMGGLSSASPKRGRGTKAAKHGTGNDDYYAKMVKSAIDLVSNDDDDKPRWGKLILL